MKKATLLLLIFITFMASCSDKNAYTIAGSAESQDEGKIVYLQAVDSLWRKRVNVDSTRIVNGKFEFSGIAKEELSVGFIEIGDGNTWSPTMIAIEPGQIRLDYGVGKGGLQGTPMNKKIQDFYSSITEENSLDESFAYEFAKENNDNQIGAYMLIWISDLLSVDQIKQGIASMSADIKNSKAIRNLEEVTRKREETDIGKDYVDIKGVTPEGQEITLSEYVGKEKYVLLCFWKPGDLSFRRGYVSDLLELYTRYNETELQIIGIYLGEDVDVWKKEIKEWGLRWPQISNLVRQNSEFVVTYGVFNSPYFILIDKDGKIVERGLYGKTVARKRFKIDW